MRLKLRALLPDGLAAQVAAWTTVNALLALLFALLLFLDNAAAASR